ncbi:hypothetical protein [Clostridium drakei]|uniref:Lipoprotein n=1 Tax=Clostridium drakei TaxID=332101 RepID=A0A2U8DSQ3_9CLOT|nr:hypothetical protein [Clostridium drakei]AWI05816.1 hypothetical protein B9W14_15345 [Clostridium drakei]
MKKHTFLSKTVTCLLVLGVSMTLFAGCQSSNNSGNTNNTTQSTKKQNKNKLSAEQMKKKVQDSIQPLVTAGTITQAQADKIIAAYEARPAGNGQKNKPQDNQQSSQQESTQNKQKFNPLSKLVSDGTITQAQADAVTQKMKENSTHKNNGQSSQNNNGQSSN